MKGSLAKVASDFADEALLGAGPCPNVGIGPIVWDIAPGHDARYWYCIVAVVSDKRKLRLTQLKVETDNPEWVEQARNALLVELVQRRPIVVMDYDDELQLARWCEALCPGKRTRTIRIGLERERTA